MAASAEGADIAARVLSGEIPFPFKRDYLPPPDTLFANLQANTYVDVSRLPYISSLRRKPARRTTRGAAPAETQYAIPWGFDRREISFIVNEAAFDAVDQLPDHFTEPARMAANIRGRPSPLAAWRDPDTVRAITRRAIGMQKIERSERPLTYFLREACYEVVPECTLFKASLAAEIYRFFGARVVFDPSGGWGDRALGAAGAGVVKYVGVDPNPALAEGYGAISKFLGRVAPRTAVVFRPIPFETYGPAEFRADFGDEPPDLIFSSPPFYDYEHYSDAPGQCAFSALDGWIALWLLPAVDRMWGALAPGGHLALYLADAGGEATGPLAAHMQRAGRRFRGVIACRRGSKRPLPLWVWQKGDEPAEVPPVERAPAEDEDMLSASAAAE